MAGVPGHLNGRALLAAGRAATVPDVKRRA